MIWKMNLHHDPRLKGWYRQVQGRPQWVWMAAVGAALLVVVVPLVLVTLAALLVGAATFTVLSLVAMGVRFLARLFGGETGGGGRAGGFQADDGRRNVRVISRP